MITIKNKELIKNTNWEEIFKLVEKGLSATAISKKINLTQFTIFKYVKIKRPDLILKIYENAKNAHILHTKIKNTNWEEIFKLVEKGMSTGAISEKVSLSPPTIFKYIKIKRPDLVSKIYENGKNEQIMARYKDGQSAKYVKLRKLIKEKKIICQKCGSDRSVEIHHKEKLNYDKFYRAWKTDNFNNNDDNVLFYCNSCHQKLHYRKLGRISKVQHCPKTGRFIKNQEEEIKCM